MPTTKRKVTKKPPTAFEGQRLKAQAASNGGPPTLFIYAAGVVSLLVLVGGALLLLRVGDSKDADVIAPNTGANNAWWKTGVTYQIYPRSFQDSDGDGVGDLRGIESRLDYVKSLGVTAIWLSPVYESPMKDFGYDISDHRKIDPIFGTMKDFKRLLKAIHERGLRLIMDFVPNHTSDLHRWFKESRRSKDNPYSDFYIWRDGKTLDNGTRVPPNNWISIFGGSTWQWDEKRQQYYYHQFIKEQPDLNYNNPKVRQEMEYVLEFWMEQGVDGFRVDAIDTLFEHKDLSDEPRTYREGVGDGNWRYLEHIHTFNQPETFEVIQSWRQLFDEFENDTGKHIYMVMESFDETDDLRHWRKHYASGPDHPFNFLLQLAFQDVNSECDGTCIGHVVDRVMKHLPAGKWPTWVIGNHDIRRISSRAGPERVDLMNMLLLLLPGTPTTYYGEEIGMQDITVTRDQVVDPWGLILGGLEGDVTKYTRDPCRSPMQWNRERNAGFSTASRTWLPVHPEYATRNVEAQNREEKTSLNKYRALVKLRSRLAFQTTDLVAVVKTRDIYAFVRQGKSSALPKYLVILNMGKVSVTLDYTAAGGKADGTKGNPASVNSDIQIHWPKTGRVVFDTQVDRLDQIVKLQRLTVKPSQGIVVEFSTA